MRTRTPSLEQQVEELLADQSKQQDPLYIALERLWEAHRDMARRIDRVSSISDAYQNLAKEKEQDLTKRLNKQLRQITKVARISDHYQKMMHDLNLALREASTHDPLTGLGNRRLLLDSLKDEVERYRRYSRPFCIAMLDIDYFKQVNDQHGHELGDTVLVEISRVLEAEIRDLDLCGRWGGEEFLIILPETELDKALVVLDRVRNAVSDLNVRVGEEALSVTVSVGVAEYHAGETYSDTINKADALLLKAKRSGRNRLESSN